MEEQQLTTNAFRFTEKLSTLKFEQLNRISDTLPCVTCEMDIIRQCKIIITQ